MIDCDYLVIGGGIAGCSVGYFLSRDAKVAVIEQESQPGYHTTGRSAASYTTVYGPSVIRALTLAGKAFFENPPTGFADAPLLSPLGVVFFADEHHSSSIDRLVDEVGDSSRLARLTGDEARAMVPALGPRIVAGAHEIGGRAIDVHALHQGFIRGLKAGGGDLHTNAPARGIARANGRWQVDTPAGTFRAPVLINAAGAWGDAIADLAGVRPLGVQPMRRTALTFRPPEGVDISRWPMAVEIDEEFYIRPEAGLIMLCLAEETPSPPCDAQPEEIDIATAIDRMERATSLRVRRVEHKWAGLRTFTADRKPAAGFDPGAEGFFWLVGQGGYGIQTSPGLGLVAAALARGEDVPPPAADLGVVASELLPDRLR